MNVAVAIDLALALLTRGAQISALISKARAAGTETISDEDWKTITDADDQARARLENALRA